MSETTSGLSSGNFTAVSPDAEAMKSFITRFRKDVDLLSAEMSDVIRIREDVGRRGQPQMDINWLNNVRAREGEVVELQKRINEIRRGGGTNLNAWHNLNKEVIVCLKAVDRLKREANHNVVAHRVAHSGILEGSVLHSGDSSSRSVKTVLKHLAKNGPISFSPNELKSYTSGFSTILGIGGFGVVYKGQFPNGTLFAVKLLHKHLTPKSVSKQFLAEVGTMGRTYHRNLVRVYGYCFHESMKALVYEYMEKGSLDKLLKDPKLEWRKMYNIVTDTGKGLSYLHENCHHRIIHLDIKPANVLIDSEFCSKIADYGLAEQYKWSLSHVTLTDLKGTYGYMAPELCLDFSSKGTSKCDVYSFGMLLFKVLESKKKGASQKWFPAEVFKKFKEGKLKEFLITDCGIEEINREDATKLVLVALCCSQYNPLDRPSMSTVVKTLEGEIQARAPLNKLVPQMFSSGVSSPFADESKYMPSSSIARDGSTPSEVSPAFAEHMPVELPRVDFEMKNQENKDIKPEVKKDEVTTVVLRVGMHCEDCAQKIKKSLVKMEGVLTADADQGNSLVTVKCDIDPNKLVDCIWKKNKKRAVIVKAEPEKKQEEKDVEPGKEKEEELGTVETKSERKCAAEINLLNKDETIRIAINQEKEGKEKPKMKVELKREDTKKIEEKQGVGKTELLREGQERIKEEERRAKLKKKKEENLGTVETRSEVKGANEIKFKKKVEEIGIANTEQENEEKAKAEVKRSQEGSREEKRRRQSEKKSEEELGRVKTKPEGQYATAEIKLQKKEEEMGIAKRKQEKEEKENARMSVELNMKGKEKIIEEKGAMEMELQKKGQKRIKERKLSAKINPEKEEEKGKENLFDNKTEESRGVETKMQTEENREDAKRVEEGLTYWRAEMQKGYYSQILSDENSNSCIIL